MGFLEPNMANAESLHETVLEAGTKRSRLARVYAEALLASALKQSPEAVEAVGDELAGFVREAGRGRRLGFELTEFCCDPSLSPDLVKYFTRCLLTLPIAYTQYANAITLQDGDRLWGHPSK